MDARSSGIDLIIEIVRIDALDVIWTHGVEVTSSKELCGLKDLVLSEGSQLSVSHDFGGAVTMPSEHEYTDDSRAGLSGNIPCGQ